MTIETAPKKKTRAERIRERDADLAKAALAKVRADRMRERNADPAFKAKVLTNLEKGRKALAAKRGTKNSDQSKGKPPATSTDDGDPTKKKGDGADAGTRRRAFGLGRFRQ